MVSQRQQMSGFTLMELLIVVIIIGLLATLALPQVPRYAELLGRTPEAKNILAMIRNAEAIYYAENGKYTGTAGDLLADIPTSDSKQHYYTYTIPTATNAAFTAQATRKNSGTDGKSPNWTKAYTITLKQDGSLDQGQI